MTALARVADRAHRLVRLLGGVDALLGDLARLRRGLRGLLGALGRSPSTARGDLLGGAPGALDHLHLPLGALGDVADRLRDLAVALPASSEVEAISCEAAVTDPAVLVT